ncbi:putative peptidylprolyl isomerase [Arabidopsis thaliana]
MGITRNLILGLACLAFVSIAKALPHEPELGSARVVFQELEMC